VLTQRGIGAVYGTSRGQAYDRWFRYPAGFSPDALGRAVTAIGDAMRIVDPFFGSGATATAVAGKPVTGIEAHPLIADLGAAKLATVPRDVQSLRDLADRVAERAREHPGDPDHEHPLVQRCFDGDVLGRLAALRDAIAALPATPWERYLRWALLGTLRDVASVKVGWPYQRPGQQRDAPYRDPVARMITRVNMIADDLETQGSCPTGRVVRGDARTAAVWKRAAAPGGFDGCVTSPPYLNNFDYADATRLELYFLGTVTSWKAMCSQVRAGMVVATTQQSARAGARRALATLKRERREVAPQLEEPQRRLNASGTGVNAARNTTRSCPPTSPTLPAS
jgi:hypothetical protein